ncbi:hypothetical protein [Caproiciproducens sp.]
MNILGMTINWVSVLYTLLLAVLGLLVSYYKANAKFRSFVAALVNDAESLDITGQEKKEWVVSQIYAILPAWLRPILTKTLLSMIVQSVFDSMRQYAAKLLDKATEAVGNVIGTVSTSAADTASTGADQAAEVKQDTALPDDK